MLAAVSEFLQQQYTLLFQSNLKNISAAITFTLIYGIRLAYQAYLLRNRDRSGEHGDWGEILLVLVPKNLLVILTIYLLILGVPFNVFFVTGWTIFLFAIALRFVALYQLGPMYSLNVDIRREHKLITGGVFSVVRHPLYLAYILDTIGIVIFLQRWYFWIVVVFVVAGWLIRIRSEEATLREAFGNRYTEYMNRVPSLNIVAGTLRRFPKLRFKAHASGEESQGSGTPSPLVGPGRNHGSELSETQSGELEVHIAEYNALSEFQRDAKSTFVRVAMYHNTGIIVVTTWVLQQASTPGGVVSALTSSGYLLPVLFALPVVNAVLIVGCAYQVYSFFCVALHFQSLRSRLSELVGRDVLAYEDKFRGTGVHGRKLSLFLDVMAATMWFVIPVVLAAVVAIGAPIWITCPTIYCRLAYWAGTTLSVVAIGYLIGVVIFMLRTLRAEGLGQRR